jgi:hypothetical protein
MANTRQYRSVIRIVTLILLGALLLVSMPVAFAHTDEHGDDCATCVCICCESSFTLAPLPVQQVNTIPQSATTIPHAVEIGSARQLTSLIDQPPRTH